MWLELGIIIVEAFVFYMIYIPSQMLMYHTLSQVSSGAAVAGVASDVDPILNNISLAFGLFMGIIVVYLTLKLVMIPFLKKFGGVKYE